MANGIYSFKFGKLRPYAGLGLGLARHAIESEETSIEVDGETEDLSKVSENSTAFAYQGMVGVGYALSDNAEVRLGYRYFATAKADFDGVDMTYGTHNFELGLLYRF